MAGCPIGDVVLDPFSVSGTSGQVALNKGGKYIGIETSKELETARVKATDKELVSSAECKSKMELMVEAGRWLSPQDSRRG